MSIRNDNINRRLNKFRISMDIGMGIFYTIIGLILLYAKSFANMPFPPGILYTIIAYFLGAMLVLGGVLRFLRGIRAIFPNNIDSNE